MTDSFIKGSRLWAERRMWSPNVDFAFFQRQGNGIAYGTNLEMFVPENGATLAEPLFSLTPSETQELMDNLWQLGFRPSEGTGSAGALKATQDHLEDMRKLVFDFLADTRAEK